MEVSQTLRRSLIYGAASSFVIAVVGSVIGALVAGLPGLVSALIGSAVGFLFVGVTALSVLLAARLTRDDPASPIFFAVIMGSWLLKFVGFLALVFVLRDLETLDPIVLFFSLVAAAVGTVAADVIAVLRSRVPYTDPLLPQAPSDSS
ncbi:MAG: hypothetical protein LH471_05335 [Salinibacterium sp.]|nr:hypothetical protein [Salinibacterium sp.]